MQGTGKLNGFESPAKEYAQRPLSLDELLLPHQGDTYLVEMDNDTMTAVGIFKHDLLVVDASLTAGDNDIIVCQLDDEMLCCCFNRTAQTISHQRMTRQITAEHNFQIFGVVANSIRCHRPAAIFP